MHELEQSAVPEAIKSFPHSSVVASAVIFTALRLLARYDAVDVKPRVAFETDANHLLRASCLGTTNDWKVVTIDVFAPSFSAMAELGRAFAQLQRRDSRYGVNDAWDAVLASLFPGFSESALWLELGDGMSRANEVSPATERLLAVRDQEFASLHQLGLLDPIRDACRVTGLGLLRVYRDASCKWSVLPGPDS